MSWKSTFLMAAKNTFKIIGAITVTFLVLFLAILALITKTIVEAGVTESNGIYPE